MIFAKNSHEDKIEAIRVLGEVRQNLHAEERIFNENILIDLYVKSI